MKKHILFLFTLLLGACGQSPIQEYHYETNPEYVWGYQEFYGDYYSRYDITNNVSTLSLFSETLDVTKDGYLTGYGQHLNLYDIFTAVSDTVLPGGTYTASDSNEPFTFMPGKYIERGNEKYITGAWIYYYEINNNKSGRKLITDGYFEINWLMDGLYFECNFITDDGKELKGRIKSYPLTVFDESSKNTTGPEEVRPLVYRNIKKK